MMQAIQQRLIRSICVSVCVSAIAIAPTIGAEPTTIYQRAQIRSAVSGSVSIGAQYEVALDLPAKDCIEGEFVCVREQRFGQLYRIEFTLDELRSEDGDGRQSVTSSAGAIYIAADIERRQELDFEAGLEQAITELHGDSFRHPYGGWNIGRPPLGQNSFLGPSNRTAWVCMEHESSMNLTRITPHFDGDELTGVTTGTLGDELQAAGCDALRGAADGDGAQSTATPYDIESLIRTEIEVSADWYPGSGRESAFQPLPEEMGYTKAEVDTEGSGSAMSYDNNTGLYVMARTGNGVRQHMTLGEFELMPARAESAAWVTRWSISTYEQSFGAQSDEERIAHEELWVVAFPIVDPLAVTDALPGDPGADRLSEIAGDFDRAAQLNVEVLAAAVHQTVAESLDEGDWILLYCSPSRTPEYGIARFFGRSGMQNGAQVCDAVTRIFR